VFVGGGRLEIAAAQDTIITAAAAAAGAPILRHHGSYGKI